MKKLIILLLTLLCLCSCFVSSKNDSSFLMDSFLEVNPEVLRLSYDFDYSEDEESNPYYGTSKWVMISSLRPDYENKIGETLKNILTNRTFEEVSLDMVDDYHLYIMLSNSDDGN